MFLKGHVNFKATCSHSHSDIVNDESESKGNIARIKAKLEKEGAFDLSPKHEAKKRLSSIPESLDDDKSGLLHEQLEFMVYCIATAVGLGNDIWRFPFVAYKNGGGAFLIPYLLLLVIVGGPLFFLETFLGQFSSSNCVKMWDMVPALRGGGLAQALGTLYVLSYYMSMIAICLFYLSKSFGTPLPWAHCEEEWINCVASGQTAKIANSTSSAEFYFRKAVLHQKDGIDDGIGAPIMSLSICLLISWIFVYIAVAKGVKNTGWLSYFLAALPYSILFILFVRAVSLPGAKNGIVFLFEPQWLKLFDIKVWYAATAQIFFSLSLCSGTISMFASFNSFRLNVYRDAMVVTSLDSLTSLISGVTMFGILGNLAHELGHETIDGVVGSGGVGLTFISYPNAIAKFPFAPQAFTVLFFTMTAVLGVGTGVLMFSSIIVVLKECFPRVGTFYLTTIGCVLGFCTGLPYVTPEEEALLNEMEVTGQAFEDMQEQNSRLIQQLREKDDANFKLMSERIKANSLHKLLREEKQLLQEQVLTRDQQIESMGAVARRLEEKERLLQATLSAVEKELLLRQQAMEMHKRKAIESAQSAADLKLHLEKYHAQMKEAQQVVAEKTSALEAEAYKTKRLHEELAILRRKAERMKKMEQAGSSMDEVLLEEIREYKETLTCPSCKVKRKDAVLTKCFHVFCWDCLRTRYETRQRKCPKCNAAFGANDYHRLYLST